jgi:acyl carrier protein
MREPQGRRCPRSYALREFGILNSGKILRQRVELRVSTRDDVIALIESWNLTLPRNWDRDTSLVRSGIIDSLALYQLILWIEERVGKPVDPTKFDLADELDTVTSIANFVEKNRGR